MANNQSLSQTRILLWFQAKVFAPVTKYHPSSTSRAISPSGNNRTTKEGQERGLELPMKNWEPSDAPPSITIRVSSVIFQAGHLLSMHNHDRKHRFSEIHHGNRRYNKVFGHVEKTNLIKLLEKNQPLGGGRRGELRGALRYYLITVDTYLLIPYLL